MEAVPPVTFGESISKAIAGITDYNSRSRRSEYWYMALLGFLFSIAFNVLATFLAKITILMYILRAIGAIVSIASLVINLPLAVRRLHDIGKTGWLLLLIFIPLVGAIILLIWFCTDSQAEANEYGPSPKYSSGSGGYTSAV